MSKTLEELQAEYDEINRVRDEKMKASQTAAREFTEISYKQNAVAAELETLKRKEAAKTIPDLESKWRTARAELEAVVKQHIATAVAELKKAKKLSDKLGIPFESPIVDLAGFQNIRGKIDVYVPASMEKLWGPLFEEDGIYEFLDAEYAIYPIGDGNDSGWAFAWAPSSMRC